MMHLYSRTSVKFALVFTTLMAAATANALLLDCTTSPGAELLPGAECTPADPVVNKTPGYVLEEAIPVTPINAALVAFQVDQARSSGPISNSVPLLVLIGALLSVLLVRAKRFNTK